MPLHEAGEDAGGSRAAVLVLGGVPGQFGKGADGVAFDSFTPWDVRPCPRLQAKSDAP